VPGKQTRFPLPVAPAALFHYMVDRSSNETGGYAGDKNNEKLTLVQTNLQ